MTHKPSKIKVAAIVLNSVSHDARVLKEAASLAEAGYQVTLIGIRDRKCPDPMTELDNGVTIYRLDVNSLILAMNNLGSLILVSLAFAIAVLALIPVAMYNQPGMTMYLIGSVVMIMYTIMAINLYYTYKVKRRLWLANLELGDSPQADSKPSFLTRSRYLILLLGRYPIRWVMYSMKYFLKPFFLYFKWKACLSTCLKVLERLDPDFIHCHDLTTLRIGTAYKKAHPGTRVIFDSHELYEEVANMTSALRCYWKKVARTHSCHVDGFITVNQSIADELKSRYPALPNPVVICNAVELTGAFPTYDGRLHEAAGVPRSMKVLLYQGGFSPHRGLEILVEAAALLPDDWVLVMMGWGNLEPELKAISSMTDPGGEKTRFIPPAPQHELRSWTCGASLGVIPYENVCMNHWFCSPNKLWEYPAAGVPILASPFPELNRVVVGNEVGVELSEPQTAEDIAAKVGELDESRLRSMKDNCIAFIEEDNWSTYARRLQNLYHTLDSRVGSEPTTHP